MKCEYDACGLERPALSGYRPTMPTLKLYELTLRSGAIKKVWARTLDAAVIVAVGLNGMTLLKTYGIRAEI